MFEVFYIHTGECFSLSIDSPDSLFNALTILHNDVDVKAVKVFIKSRVDWFQCIDLYRDFGFGFKCWEAFRSGSFYSGDWEV